MPTQAFLMESSRVVLGEGAGVGRYFDALVCLALLTACVDEVNFADMFRADDVSQRSNKNGRLL